MTTRRDDGADQPRCGHVHHHESNGGLGRMGHNAIDAKPWCEPCPEPAAPPPAPAEDVAAALHHPVHCSDCARSIASLQRERDALAADMAAARAALEAQRATTFDVCDERDAAIARADLAESHLDGQAWEDLTRENERLRAHAEFYRLALYEAKAELRQVRRLALDTASEDRAADV